MVKGRNLGHRCGAYHRTSDAKVRMIGKNYCYWFRSVPAGIFCTGMQTNTIIPSISPLVKFRLISRCFGQFRPKYKFRPVPDFGFKKKKKKSYHLLLLLLGYGPFFFLFFFFPLLLLGFRPFFFFFFFFFFWWVSDPSSSLLLCFIFSSSVFQFCCGLPVCLSFFICVLYR